MRKTIRLACIVILAFTAGWVTHRSVTADERSLRAALAGADNPKLDAVVPAVDWDKVPLRDALAGLGNVSSLNIVLMAKELEFAEIDLDHPIDLHLQNVLLRDVLDTVATRAGGVAKLGWRCEGDTVWFSTAREIASHTVMKVYDVGSLKERFLKEMALQPEPADTRFGADKATKSEEAVEHITTFIKTHATTDEWQDNGGTIASIWVFGNRLFITHNVDGHRQVAAALVRLEGRP